MCDINILSYTFLDEQEVDIQNCCPHGYWNFFVFSISLNFMAMTNFSRSKGLQIQIAQMAVFENI